MIKPEEYNETYQRGATIRVENPRQETKMYKRGATIKPEKPPRRCREDEYAETFDMTWIQTFKLSLVPKE